MHILAFFDKFFYMLIIISRTKPKAVYSAN